MGISDCDAKMVRHRQALEAGADPVVVAAWIDEAKAQKAQALSARSEKAERPAMSRNEIRAFLDKPGEMTKVPAAAAPQAKAEIDQRLGTRLHAS